MKWWKKLFVFIINLKEFLTILIIILTFYISWANQPILAYQILPNWESNIIKNLSNSKAENNVIKSNHTILNSSQKLILYFNYVDNKEKLNIFIRGNLDEPSLYSLSVTENFKYSAFQLNNINQTISELAILNSEISEQFGYVVIYGNFHGVTEIFAKDNKSHIFTFNEIGKFRLNNKMERVITDYALLILIVLTGFSIYIGIGRLKK